MQRRHGRLIFKQQSSAWGLTALLLMALLGISLVSEPERVGAGEAQADAALAPAHVEAEPAFADRAYAVSVGEVDEAALLHMGDGQKEEPQGALRKAGGP